MIFLGPEAYRLCRAHAERVVAAYQAGRKPRSEAIDREGERLHGSSIRNDVDAQTVGRLGEWGTAAELGLDPINVLSWTDIPDNGVDFHFQGLAIDTKATVYRNGKLLFPATKKHLLNSTPADIFVLVHVDASHRREHAEVDPIRWIWVEEFKRLHRTAGTYDKLWTGTPYMDAEKCHPFKTLPQHERPLL